MRIAKILVFVLIVPLILIIAALITDWGFLRQPLERIASEKIGRQVTLEDFSMRLRPLTRIHLQGLKVANIADAEPTQMAALEAVDVQLRLLPLLKRAVDLESLSLHGGELHLMRDATGHNNWTLPQQDDKGPGVDLNVRALSLDRIGIHLDDRSQKLSAHIRADTIPLEKPEDPYSMKLEFDGRYNGGSFGGIARTGGVMTLRDSGTPFPFFIDAKGGSTKVWAQGQVGDILGEAQIDVDLDVAGPTLSNLYPFINLPLPTTPAYRIKGHLKRDGMNFHLSRMNGRIGSTDIAGSASYEKRAERPLLKAQLTSRLLDMKDLGPLIGVDESATTAQAAGKPKKAASDGRVLPDAEFRLDRINAIDADVTLAAADVKIRGPWAFDNFAAHLILTDGVLKLAPLNFGYAGGQLRSDITLDAREKSIRADARIAVQKARLNKLFPDVELMKSSDGTLGADIRLKSRGNSIRSMLGRANGEVGLAVTGGEISNLLVEVIGLDASQALGFLLGGDKKTHLRCAVSTFEVKNGLGTAQVLVIDTDDTRIDGSGTISLADEKLDLRLEPKPKDKSILVARSPINIVGTFADPGFKIDKASLLTRAGAALGLALINPLAALIPLIETGPGTDANCQQLLAATRQASKNSGAAQQKR